MFFSKTPVEDINAKNTAVNSLFNSATGDIAFSMMMKDFEFKKSLMKEHFNEKYLETDKFPKSTFQGKLIGYSVDKAGVQEVKGSGKLTIHGVTKEVETTGTVEFVNGKAIAKSKFIVLLKDYDIKIPQLLWKNIAESIDVTIDLTYKPTEK
jgi:polyisoprenoid-binding protein YceI